MADNGLLDPAVAAAIERVPGVERRGDRIGNWLTKEQANDLLSAPDPCTLIGTRERAILALLIGCDLRRAEVVSLEWKASNSDRLAGQPGPLLCPPLHAASKTQREGAGRGVTWMNPFC